MGQEHKNVMMETPMTAMIVSITAQMHLVEMEWYIILVVVHKIAMTETPTTMPTV